MFHINNLKLIFVSTPAGNTATVNQAIQCMNATNHTPNTPSKCQSHASIR